VSKDGSQLTAWLQACAAGVWLSVPRASTASPKPSVNVPCAP
jgi:hypothetical protein